MLEEIIKKLFKGKKFIKYWCACCSYPSYFFVSPPKVLMFNNGCRCFDYLTSPLLSSEKDIKDHLEMNPKTDFLNEEYWQ